MATALEHINTDLDAFVDTNVFGESVTYTPSGGSASTINGVFDAAAQFVDPVDGVTVTTNPAIVVKTESASSAKKGDTITRSGVTYYVKKAEHDGMGDNGMTTLILSRDNFHQ